MKLARVMAVAPLSLCVFALAACKSKPTTDTKPSDEVDRDQLFAEQKRIASGEVVGEALRAPKIVVGTDVTINATKVVARAELETTSDAGSFARVEPVFARLKGLREHWKQIHPGEEFKPEAEVTLPADIAMSPATNVLVSIAFAGYPKMTIHAGDVTIAIDWPVPGPPATAPEHAPEPNAILSFDGGWKLRRSLRDPGRDGVAPTGFARACMAPEDIDDATVKNAIASVCGIRCASLVVFDRTDFHHAAQIASAALAGTPQSFRALGFTAADPCVDAPTGPIPAPLASSASMAFRIGTPYVSGPLAANVIDAAVRSHLGVFRACYAAGLKANPGLQGRVAVKLVIDRDGAVASATDGGSDLPDQSVVACVARSFAPVAFPKAASHTIAVVPIVFSPK